MGSAAALRVQNHPRWPSDEGHYGEAIFEPDGDGTLVTWRCQFESKVPGLGWPMQWFVTRIFRNGLDGLAKRYFPDR